MILLACIEIGRTDPSPEQLVAQISISSDNEEDNIDDEPNDLLFKLAFIPSSVDIVVDNMQVSEKVKLREEMGLKSHHNSNKQQSSNISFRENYASQFSLLSPRDSACTSQNLSNSNIICDTDPLAHPEADIIMDRQGFVPVISVEDEALDGKTLKSECM